MKLDNVNQFSDMLLMPHTDVQANTIEQHTINSNKNNSFKDELEISSNAKNTKLVDESDKPIHNNENKYQEKNNSNNDKDTKAVYKDNEPDTKDKNTEANKDAKKSNNELDNRDVNNKSNENKVKNSSEQNISLESKIENIKENIVKNEAVKEQIKENIINNQLTNTKKTSTEQSAEKLLFQQSEDKPKTTEKTDIIEKKEFKTVVENRFKNIKDMGNEVEQKTEAFDKQEPEKIAKESINIIKTEPVKEAVTPANLNLNLEKEIITNEIKLDKTSNTRQILEQYQEISDKILNKVDNVIKYMATKGTEAVSIRLQPPELGKIHIELTIKDNSINAKINTENIAVKEVILTNIDQLKAGIENNGFNINKLDVEIGGFKNFLSNDSQSFNKKGKNGTKNNKGGGLGFNNGAEVINKPLNPYTFFVGRSVNMLV